MEPFIPTSKKGPEFIIQKKIIKALRSEEWFVKPTMGNEYQSGFPDLYACNMRYGSRWIEVKCPTGYNFTQPQLEDFPKFTNNGSGVWVLTNELEIGKLHHPANWYQYLRWNTRSAPRERKLSKLQPSGPEYKIQKEIKAALESDGWFVKETVGNIYQHGFPDLYATHAKWRSRWIEVKNPEGYIFTPAQIITFPQFTAHGVGVWVLTDASQIELLFKPANWYTYLELWRS